MAATVSVSKSKVEARLATLRSRAKRKDVEVEHLIAFAQIGDSAAAQPLRDLAAEYAWPRKGARIVPLAAWVDVIAMFLEKGADGIVAAAKRKKLDVELVLSLLEELPSAKSATGALTIALGAEKERKEPLLKLALSALGMAIDDVTLDAKTSRAARELAHRQLARKLGPVEVMACYNVLAVVGDATSAERIKARPLLTGAWKGAEKKALRAIAKRS